MHVSRLGNDTVAMRESYFLPCCCIGYTPSSRHWQTFCPNITACPCRPRCQKVRISLENAVQRSDRFDAPGCMNTAGKLRQKWQATTPGTKFTKPGVSTSAISVHCRRMSGSQRYNETRDEVMLRQCDSAVNSLAHE